MPSLMKMMSAAALMALASCGANPALAQACVSLDNILEQAREAAAAGGEIHLLDQAEARQFLAILVAQVGDPPRKLELTSAVLLIGPQGAVIALAEGTQACFNVTLPRDFALIALRSVKGTPA
jgi:Asp/Glu/hydantoin racemase